MNKNKNNKYPEKLYRIYVSDKDIGDIYEYEYIGCDETHYIYGNYSYYFRISKNKITNMIMVDDGIIEDNKEDNGSYDVFTNDLLTAVRLSLARTHCYFSRMVIGHQAYKNHEYETNLADITTKNEALELQISRLEKRLDKRNNVLGYILGFAIFNIKVIIKLKFEK